MVLQSSAEAKKLQELTMRVRSSSPACQQRAFLYSLGKQTWQSGLPELKLALVPDVQRKEKSTNLIYTLSASFSEFKRKS